MSHKGATERARRMSHLVIGPWGHGPYAEVRGPRFRTDGQCRRPGAPATLVRPLAEGNRQRAGERSASQAVRHGQERVGLRARVSARPHRLPAFVLQQRGQGEHRRGRRPFDLDEANRRLTDGRFRYDPDDPVPSVGGNNCCGTPTAAGPQDQRPIEGRRDVLVYTTDVLSEELEATGPVKVVLYAASDAVDTDFVAKLVDVHPDGSSYNMAEGILRARYREGLTTPRPLTPGQVNRLEIDLVGTSIAFLRGTPDPRARHEQPLSAVRSQSEYGRRLRHECRRQGGGADHLSRWRKSVACSSAGDSTPALIAYCMGAAAFVTGTSART